jgi:N-acetylmuramoyl-L-alanine amidase
MSCDLVTQKAVRSIFILITLLLVSLLGDAEAKTPFFKGIKKTVVLDPGHGGHDIGARGPDGGLEKNVTLKLATELAAALRDEYKVVMTRTGDYGLDLAGRTNTANHSEAYLFISIHTGGSFLHNAGGIIIFYFRELSDQTLASGFEPLKSFEESDDQITWDEIQQKHTGSSSILAKSIQSRISGKVKFSRCNVQSAPLLVLRGADMPAVLIETGYLTNPAEEKALKDPEVISRLAAAIRQGIEDFFSKFE